MIGISEEYEKMFQLEEKLWWYRILHERVVKTIQKRYPERKDITILDVGCGTGGMLASLRNNGYTNLKGIDGSMDAVAFCEKRGFSVTLLNLNELASFEPDARYDVLICNDVFCYFNDADLDRLLGELVKRLKPTGLLICNNNAFNVFRGQHDLAVGSIRRFVKADFTMLATKVSLHILESTYWSFVLSPMILLMRQWQNVQLRLGWQKPDNAQSDVYLPSEWLNETLYQIVHIEDKLLPRTPFGSSLFVVLSPAG